MPSAQGPIFCRKELWEKVGSEGLIFSRTKSQRTRTNFLSELLCVTIAGEVSLLDDVTPTEVSAHGPIFVVRVQQLWRRSERFYIGAKVSAQEPIFTLIFVYDKKSVRVRWALVSVVILIKAPTRWHCVTLQVQAFVQS